MDKKKWITIIAAVVSAFTFLWVFFDLITGRLQGFVYFEIMHRFGHTAIIMLLLSSLSVLAKNYSLPEGFFPHRVFGLYGLLYAASHFFVFMLSFGFDLQLLITAFVSQPFILLGDLALIVLFVMQLTSSDKFRKQHHKTWRLIHYFYYLGIGAIITHIFLVSKVIKPVFWVYLAGFVLMGLLHAKFVRDWIKPKKKSAS
ncbi:MAG: ferric reductase-like transmembrane domain-containing protein [Anaerolineae bacterium]|nr:ferric reductase-like transmembrane domain-containing protein [Anaerolineae bacterium]